MINHGVWHIICRTLYYEITTKGKHYAKSLYPFNIDVTWLQGPTIEQHALSDRQESEPSKKQRFGMDCINAAGSFLRLSWCCFCRCSGNVDAIQGFLCGWSSPLHARESGERKEFDILQREPKLTLYL